MSYDAESEDVLLVSVEEMAALTTDRRCSKFMPEEIQYDQIGCKMCTQ